MGDQGRRAVLAVAALGLVILLPRLGASGLWDPWEPRYAQAAREMSARGDWALPYYREDPRLNKPPLTYWLIGMSQAVVGVNETGSRLPSALLAVLCATGLAAALVSRGRATEGLLAGAALVTVPQWVLLGRFATPDIPLAASLGLALAGAIALPSSRGTPRRVAVAAIVVGIALAGLTDWPRGLLIPAWAVLAWSALQGRRSGIALFLATAAVYHWGQLTYNVPLNLAAIGLALAGTFLVLLHDGVRPRMLFAGAAAIAAIVAPWFLLAASLAPAGEMSIFEYKHALNLGESTEQHRGPYFFVAWIVLIGAIPWAPAAVAGLAASFGRARDDPARLLAAAFVGPLAFFTLAEPRMGHMYAVMQPALAGLAAVGLAAVARRRAVPLALGAATLVWAGYAAWDKPARILESATVKSNLFGRNLEIPALVAIAAVAVVCALTWWRRDLRIAIAGILPAALLSGYLGLALVPGLEEKKSLVALWRAHQADREAEETIGVYGRAKDSPFFYSDNAVLRMKSSRALGEFLAAPGTRHLILPRKDWSRLKKSGRLDAMLLEVMVDSHPTHLLVRVGPH